MGLHRSVGDWLTWPIFMTIPQKFANMTHLAKKESNAPKMHQWNWASLFPNLDTFPFSLTCNCRTRSKLTKTRSYIPEHQILDSILFNYSCFSFWLRASTLSDIIRIGRRNSKSMMPIALCSLGEKPRRKYSIRIPRPAQHHQSNHFPGRTSDDWYIQIGQWSG